MQLSMILVSLCGMALAVPGTKIRSPHKVDDAGRLVFNEGEFPHGNPALPEGAGDTNELGDGLQVPDNIDELAQGAAHKWNGQDLGADVLGDLGAVS
ncbi:hypothetical protein ARSEF1564_008460 [Beauveria bassiana]